MTSLLINSRADAILDALELLGRPAFTLSKFGRVMRFNARAAPLIGKDLKLTQHRLSAADDGGNAELQRLVASIQVPHFPGNVADLRPALIRREELPPLVVRVLPVIGALSDVLDGARAILVVTDTGAPRVPAASLLESAFGLTPAESRLALRLVETGDLASAARSLGIMAGTARNQLKSVFRKTDTARQSELMSLLVTMGSA
ncbi:helix-turn-helix transcriptional regulator [Xanthobacter autotrophicus]|uniref:helix-turn-helix transcriptional regulator n=1 Tax=Xanthobacter autotrophicus TaxID=280 RepID=UPI0037284E09